MKKILWVLLFSYFCVSVPVCCLLSAEESPGLLPSARLDDGWRISTPAAEGMDQAQIKKISAEIDSGRFQGIHSYLVIKNGALVHEAYFDDWGRDSLHVIMSITKSVTSTLVGIAIERGEIPDVEATLPELLPEYADDITDPLARTVNLEHLLTLHSGFDWDETTHSYRDERNTERQMVNSPHWVKFFLDLPMRDQPGTRYLYNTGSVHLISAILRSRTGLFADEYLRKHLLEPLGIEHFEWNRDPQRYPCTGGTHGGLWMRPRDLAKFAYLFLHGGRWQGRQVVPEHWVELATTAKADAGPGKKIGYLWWMGHYDIGGRRLRYFYGAGYGGQTISYVPELHLLVIFTCWSRSDDCDFFGPLFMTIKAALPAEERAATGAAGEDRGADMVLPDPPAFVASASAKPGDTFELSHRLDENSEFSFRWDKRSRYRLTVEGGNELLIGSESGATWGTRVIARESDGLDLELTCQDHTYRMDLPEPKKPADFTELTGQKIRTRLSTTGEWSDFRGLDLLPVTTLPGEKVPWSKDHCVLEVQSLLPFLPGKTVEMGESWTHRCTRRELVGGQVWVPVTVNCAYTLVDRNIAQGKDCLRVAANFTLHAAAEIMMDGIPWNFRFTGSGTGSYLFAWRQGLVLGSEESSSLVGRATAEEIGQVIPFQSDVQTSVKVEF
jgi:CubicO group peptidase (beta-lactamase class C family)